MKRTGLLKTTQKLLIRLISSWLFGLGTLAVLLPKGVFTKPYDKIITPILPVIILGYFCLLTLVSLFKKDSKKTDYGMLLASAIMAGGIYCAIAGDFVFTVAVFGLICTLAAFCFKEGGINPGSWEISQKTSEGVILTAAFWAFVFLSVLTVLRFLSFRAPNYDFGIFVNMFHNMRTKLIPLVSSERDMLLSHFAVHFSPIFYFLLPFYALFPYPHTLLILQALAIAGGVIPLWLIAKRYKLSNLATTLFCAVYLLYPAFIGGAFFDFHENKLLLPIILWLLYFSEKRKLLPMYIFAVLLCMVKEDAPVYAAIIGLYLLISKKEYRHGPIIAAGSILYFIFVVLLLENRGLGVMTWRYNNISDGGFPGIIFAVVKNPLRVLKECLTGEKLLFFFQTMLPLMFLPLLTKKFSRYILLIPYILINLMSNYGYQYSVNHQYSYGSGALLFCLATLNFADLKNEVKNFAALGALLATVLSFLTTITARTNYLSAYIQEKERIIAMNSVLKQIPPNAAVTSSTFILPHLAKREHIYEYPSQNETDYIVIDLRWQSKNKEEEIFADIKDSGYRLVVKVEGVIALFVNSESQYAK